MSIAPTPSHKLGLDAARLHCNPGAQLCENLTSARFGFSWRNFSFKIIQRRKLYVGGLFPVMHSILYFRCHRAVCFVFYFSFVLQIWLLLVVLIANSAPPFCLCKLGFLNFVFASNFALFCGFFLVKEFGKRL